LIAISIIVSILIIILSFLIYYVDGRVEVEFEKGTKARFVKQCSFFYDKYVSEVSIQALFNLLSVILIFGKVQNKYQTANIIINLLNILFLFFFEIISFILEAKNQTFYYKHWNNLYLFIAYLGTTIGQVVIFDYKHDEGSLALLIITVIILAINLFFVLLSTLLRCCCSCCIFIYEKETTTKRKGSKEGKMEEGHKSENHKNDDHKTENHKTDDHKTEDHKTEKYENKT